MFVLFLVAFFNSLLDGDTLHLARCMAARMALEESVLLKN